MQEFDLSLKIEEVKIGDEVYELREASGEAAVAYQNACQSSVVLDAKLQGERRITGLRGMGNVEPLLVSMCLFDSQGKSVSQETILHWPAKVQKWCYEWILDNSDLREKETNGEAAKNVPVATTDGSE